MSQYLLAFDSFKDALPAAEACRLAAEAIAETSPSARIYQAPLTDGGEGFLEIMVGQLGGEIESIDVTGPRYQPVTSGIGWIPFESLAPPLRQQLGREAPTGRLAVIEMASASGLESLRPELRDPWETTTRGTGELIQHAARSGADMILLGIGGSATNDCGMGALEALGVIAYERDLSEVKQLHPARWKHINNLGGPIHKLNDLPPLRIACDVNNPLLGERGATAVFGPQKGLREDDQTRFERQMRKTATRLLGLFGKDPADYENWFAMPSGGAAGGIGFGLKCALPDVAFIPGSNWIHSVLDLETRVTACDVLISGEGRLDQSSLEGKGPVSLLSFAGSGQRIYLLVGTAEDAAVTSLTRSFPKLKVRTLAEPESSLPENLAQTPDRLQAAVREIAAE